jgi:hypothetical protein
MCECSIRLPCRRDEWRKGERGSLDKHQPALNRQSYDSRLMFESDDVPSVLSLDPDDSQSMILAQCTCGFQVHCCTPLVKTATSKLEKQQSRSHRCHFGFHVVGEQQQQCAALLPCCPPLLSSMAVPHSSLPPLRSSTALLTITCAGPCMSERLCVCVCMGVCMGVCVCLFVRLVFVVAGAKRERDNPGG